MKKKIIKASTLKGLLVEEIVLFLLQNSGYKTVTDVSKEITLREGRAGIEVAGRGTEHQIDAIANFLINSPFSFPQRLFVEAKCYRSKVGLEVTRNAVGTLKDIQEYWDFNKSPNSSRYHYQYAIFSTSGFSKNAIQYAYAQDIFLFTLKNNFYLKGVLEEIQNISESHTIEAEESISVLKRLRMYIRESLNQNTINEYGSDIGEIVQLYNLDAIIETIKNSNFAYIGMIDNFFPIFLVQNPERDIKLLKQKTSIRFYWNDEYWYITDTDGLKLFSFNLPKSLIDFHKKREDESTSQYFVRMKGIMSTIMIYIKKGDQLEIKYLNLDSVWYESLLDKTHDIY